MCLIKKQKEFGKKQAGSYLCHPCKEKEEGVKRKGVNIFQQGTWKVSREALVLQPFKNESR
jgi:ribosomal protein L37AE/L43A